MWLRIWLCHAVFPRTPRAETDLDIPAGTGLSLSPASWTKASKVLPCWVSGGLGTGHMPGDRESSGEMGRKYRTVFISSHSEGTRTCWLGKGDAERAWSTYCLHDWRGSHA